MDAQVKIVDAGATMLALRGVQFVVAPPMQVGHLAALAQPVVGQRDLLVLSCDIGVIVGVQARQSPAGRLHPLHPFRHLVDRQQIVLALAVLELSIAAPRQQHGALRDGEACPDVTGVGADHEVGWEQLGESGR